jgi:hypothetical protein
MEGCIENVSFIATGTSLPSHCLTMKEEIRFTEHLLSNDWRDTQTMEGLYEVYCEMGFRCHDVHVKFREDWFRHSEIGRGGGGEFRVSLTDNLEITTTSFRKVDEKMYGLLLHKSNIISL